MMLFSRFIIWLIIILLKYQLLDKKRWQLRQIVYSVNIILPDE